VTTIFERRLPVAAAWYALGVAWLFAAVLTVAFVQKSWRLAALARSDQASYSFSNRSDDPREVRAAPTLSAHADFVAALPSVIDPDATIRFTSRLAQDQDVRISQMQSQPMATDAKKLGQAKFTLQLRGDYPHIKNVVIGLLAKFPGLTLQRLTIHHRDAAPGNPADKGDDEASLELIQFVRPAAMS
jgi:hypothetical protein